MSIKYREDSITGIRKREAQQAKIAESAVLTDGSIHLTLPAGHVCDGTTVKFCAPCSCEAVTGGLVIDGETYTVVNPMLECVTGVGGVWDAGAQLSVVIDYAEKRAFLLNANNCRCLETLILSEPPTSGTVGEIGQHAICGIQVYVCVDILTNGDQTKYIWINVKGTRVEKEMILITESKTIDFAALGLNKGDEIIVACISGGDGGGNGYNNYTGSAMEWCNGGDAGKGGCGFASFNANATTAGPGGGAGGGYGAGGGGGGGYFNGGGGGNYGGVGGDGGSCHVQTVELLETTVAVTIGAAGRHGDSYKQSERCGGTTSFGSYFSVTGGGGAAGGAREQYGAGAGGGGGGGWYYVSGLRPTQCAAGKAGNGVGGDGGGPGNGKGGTNGLSGGDTVSGAGHGAVLIWF